ncbi:MAG: hypothetical protein JO334_05400 [Verrucomicrobia bacterium]|nr:hypothetical protein [Verrucomicrobiota bacterium]
MEPHPEEYDVIVLGSGGAGKYIAWSLARKGMRAVLCAVRLFDQVVIAGSPSFSKFRA